MPQTVNVVTFELTSRPEGIVAELCGTGALEDRIESMAHRCRQAAILLYALQNGDLGVDEMRLGMEAVETMLGETALHGSLVTPDAAICIRERVVS